MTGMLKARLGVLAGALLMSVGADAVPAAPRGDAVEGIQPGLWRLTQEGGAPREICIADRQSLVQIRHGEMSCSRMEIASDRSAATYHYSCPGQGWGRTSLRVESPRLVRIDTQGIAGKSPFAFTAEARRTGDCASEDKRASR